MAAMMSEPRKSVSCGSSQASITSGPVPPTHVADHVRARFDGRSLLVGRSAASPRVHSGPLLSRQRQDEARLEQGRKRLVGRRGAWRARRRRRAGVDRARRPLPPAVERSTVEVFPAHGAEQVDRGIGPVDPGTRVLGQPGSRRCRRSTSGPGPGPWSRSRQATRLRSGPPPRRRGRERTRRRPRSRGRPAGRASPRPPRWAGCRSRSHRARARWRRSCWPARNWVARRRNRGCRRPSRSTAAVPGGPPRQRRERPRRDPHPRSATSRAAIHGRRARIRPTPTATMAKTPRPRATASRRSRAAAFVGGIGCGSETRTPSASRRASAKASLVGYRSSGRLAMPLASTASTAAGSSGRMAEADGGGSWRWAMAMAMSVSRANGVTPVRQWNGDAGQRVLIGATVDRAALDLLGRDVVEGAHEGARSASGRSGCPDAWSGRSRTGRRDRPSRCRDWRRSGCWPA